MQDEVYIINIAYTVAVIHLHKSSIATFVGRKKDSKKIVFLFFFWRAFSYSVWFLQV